jgi:hypothetical protein
MLMARPTVYCEEAQKIADEYVGGGFTKNEEVIPTVEGLAEVLGVNEDTIGNWAKDRQGKPLFGATYDLLKIRQKKLIKSKTLLNKWNAKIGQFILNTDHGMSEKSVQELQGKVEVSHSPSGAFDTIVAEAEAKIKAKYLETKE